MPLWVAIRAAPLKAGDSCPVFNPAVWWKAEDLLNDARFRVVDRLYYHSVACLYHQEMRDLQRKFQRYAAVTDHWQRESDRLDRLLDNPEMSGRCWVITIYEWESGLD